MSAEKMNRRLDPDGSESLEIDLEYIIEEKPPSADVREFMRANLSTIRSREDEMFDTQK